MPIGNSFFNTTRRVIKPDPAKEEKIAFQNAVEAIYKKRAKVAIAFIIASLIILVAAVIISGIIAGLITQPYVFEPTMPPTTTKRGDLNTTQLGIGQFCIYNNQCPEKTYCTGTCQCPLNYYVNSSTGNCTLRKTNGAACSGDFECNHRIGLRCIIGTCQCETIGYFWNSTYSSGTGTAGRCQKRKTHGMACSGGDGVTGINYYGSGTWGSQITRFNKKL